MIAGLALVLSLAAPQAAPAPPPAGTAAPAPRAVRPVDTLSPPDPSAEEFQSQIDAPRAPRAKERQLQIDTLREQRPSLLPPTIVLGVGVSCLLIGAIVSANANNDVSGRVYGDGVVIGGAAVALVGVVWLIVDAVSRGNIDREIEVLEAQQRNASSGVRVTPWARDGAGGLALSLP